MKSKYAEKNDEELLAEESEMRTALFNLRVQNTTKALENPMRIRQTKRELARLKTEQSARRKAAGKGK